MQLTTAIIDWQDRLCRVQAMFLFSLYCCDQNQLVKEKVYFPHRFRQLPIIEEIQSRKLRQEPVAGTERGHWLSFHGLLSCISYPGPLAEA